MDRSRRITWVLESGLYSVHVTADTWREITLVSTITPLYNSELQAHYLDIYPGTSEQTDLLWNCHT